MSHNLSSCLQLSTIVLADTDLHYCLLSAASHALRRYGLLLHVVTRSVVCRRLGTPVSPASAEGHNHAAMRPAHHHFCNHLLILHCPTTKSPASRRTASMRSYRAKFRQCEMIFLSFHVYSALHRCKTRSSAIAEGPRDASCQLKSCQLPRNSAETTYTTSPDQIDGMKLEI